MKFTFDQAENVPSPHFPGYINLGILEGHVDDSAPHEYSPTSCVPGQAYNHPISHTSDKLTCIYRCHSALQLLCHCLSFVSSAPWAWQPPKRQPCPNARRSTPPSPSYLDLLSSMFKPMKSTTIQLSVLAQVPMRKEVQNQFLQHHSYIHSSWLERHNQHSGLATIRVLEFAIPSLGWWKLKGL